MREPPPTSAAGIGKGVVNVPEESTSSSGIVAPPKTELILPGITNGAVWDFAREAGIAFEIRQVTKAEVLEADEMWLTSSTKEVLAITTVDGQPFAGGKPGALFRKMHAVFQAHKPR